MNPTSQTSQAEIVLTAVINRFAAYVAASGAPNTTAPLAGVGVGPYLGMVQGQKMPWLTIDLVAAARKRVTADGLVENRATLDLTLVDAAAGDQDALLLAYRWGAWLESILIPESEQNGDGALGGAVDWVEPVAVAVEAGGLGFSDFTVRTRFTLGYATALGAPFSS